MTITHPVDVRDRARMLPPVAQSAPRARALLADAAADWGITTDAWSHTPAHGPVGKTVSADVLLPTA